MESDRRTRRTKKLLTDAFIDLLSSKKLNEITIKELCDKADINRGTFYLHYQDIYDLKQQIETDLYKELAKFIFPITTMNELDSYQLFYDLFSFTKRNEHLFTTLLGPNGDISFLTELKTLFKQYYLSPLLMEQYSSYAKNIEYAYDFISAGFAELVTRWLMSEHPDSIEDMARLTSKMVFDGLPALIPE